MGGSKVTIVLLALSVVVSGAPFVYGWLSGVDIDHSHPYVWSGESEILVDFPKFHGSEAVCTVTPTSGEAREFVQVGSHRRLSIRVPWFSGDATVACDSATVFTGAQAVVVRYSMAPFLLVLVGWISAYAVNEWLTRRWIARHRSQPLNDD